MTKDLPGRRMLGLDAARGVALLGMIVVNVGPLDGDGIWQRLYLLPYGRASVLFVVVAGIGMATYLRAHAADARRWPTVVWRAALLFSGGLALQRVTDDLGVILPVYGLLFLLALGLQRARPRTWLLGAGVATVIGPVLIVSHVVSRGGRHVTDPVAWGDPAGQILHGLILSGRYPLVTWLVPFLVGMWVASSDLRDGAVTRRLMTIGGLAAIGGFLLAQIAPLVLGARAEGGFARLLTGVAHGQMPLWLVSSVGGAVFVIAASMHYWSKIQHVAGPVAAAGRMALTLYVVHVLVLTAITPDSDFSFGQGLLVSAGMSIAFLTIAALWTRLLGAGPLERLLRATWLRRLSRRHPVRTSAHASGASSPTT